MSDSGPLAPSTDRPDGLPAEAASAGPAAPSPAPPAAEPADGGIDLLGIRSFFSVALPVIRRTDQLAFHLYVRHYGKGFVPFRFAGTPLSDADRQKLLVRGIRQVFVDIRHHEAFWKHISDQLPAILADESIDALERALALYQVADRLAEDLSGAPGFDALPGGGPVVPAGPNREQLVRARALVRLLAGHTLHTHVLSDAMEEVVAAESHPGAHLLHVACHGLHLATGLKLPVHQMAELALGCMLHDAGRSLVSTFGAGADPDADREHPGRCAARLRELAANCPGAIAIAEQHHERLDGSGFPRGLRDGQIHLWARICALADVFDDLVTPTGRGREALPPQQALDRMKQDVPDRFDAELFELFARQVKVRPGPSVQPDRPLRGAMPTPLLPGGRKADRRQFPRFPFRKTVVVRPADGGSAGAQDTARSIDLSRGGIHFILERPLPAGRVIRVAIPSDRGEPKQLTATVVHCRQLSSGQGYDVGARFIRV